MRCGRCVSSCESLERAAKAGANGSAALDVDELAAQAAEVAGATILTAAVGVADGDALLEARRPAQGQAR